MPFVDMRSFLEADRALKGGDFERESVNLTDVYQGRAKSLTRRWLQIMGQGDEKNTYPFQTKLLKRFVRTASVTWSTAPARRLTLDGADLPDGGPESRLLGRAYRKLNVALKQAARWRTLLGQCAITFSPNDRRRQAVPRIFAPHNYARAPDPSNADDPSSDHMIAFRVAANASDPDRSIWHLWIREGEDEWSAFRVLGSGELATDEHALFPGGAPDFTGAPFVLIYDEDPEGHAYLPLDETRTAFSLGANVVLNEILYLLKQEAHTVLYGSGFTNTQDLPKRWGPGEFWGFEDAEATISAVALNPKLAESIAISEHLTEVFAAGEGLPADYFSAQRRYETGAAGKLRNQDLEARRLDQQQSAVETEETIFDIVREIHNANAVRWNLAPFPVDAELVVELARPIFPTDMRELQQVFAFDMSIGAAAITDYLMERYRIPTREQAIEYWHRVQSDRAAYPLRENPSAILGGPRAAGEGTATPVGADGAEVERDASSINPDRASSVEGGSVVAAARRGLGA